MADATSLRRIIAHLYQRSGRPAQSESELANALSLDLKWYPPTRARELVAGLARAGYLERTDDGDLAPTFDVRGEAVPLGFRPPPDIPSDLPSAGSAPVTPAAPAARNEPPRPAPARTANPPAAPTDAAPASGTDDGSPGHLLTLLANASGHDIAHWVQRMETVVRDTDDGITPSAALLLAAALDGIDVQPWLAGAKAHLAQRSADAR